MIEYRILNKKWKVLEEFGELSYTTGSEVFKNFELRVNGKVYDRVTRELEIEWDKERVWQILNN